MEPIDGSYEKLNKIKILENEIEGNSNGDNFL